MSKSGKLRFMARISKVSKVTARICHRNENGKKIRRTRGYGAKPKDGTRADAEQSCALYSASIGV